MASSGYLTMSGMLYEGNFTEWEHRMHGILEMHDYDVDYDSTKPNHLKLDWEVESWPYDSMQAVGLISTCVSKALMSRVPIANRKTPNAFLFALRALATPFRLNDLPLELRCRIYGFHFAQKTSYRLSCTGFRSNRHGGYHQSTAHLLRASRAVRMEATPIFYGGLEPNFYWRIPSRKPNETLVERAIRTWVRDQVKENAGYLRYLQIEMETKRDVHSITFSLNQNTGLEVKFSSKFPQPEKRNWESHVKKIEANRKAFGLQGQAIIWAVTSKADIWDIAL
ncbi:hypothetical protein LTR27_009461 [Elasticomyces elasticus]|nr:hypothetical protein LTR27_009461 [Elasticomyces elasticus]